MPAAQPSAAGSPPGAPEEAPTETKTPSQQDAAAANPGSATGADTIGPFAAADAGESATTAESGGEPAPVVPTLAIGFDALPPPTEGQPVLANVRAMRAQEAKEYEKSLEIWMEASAEAPADDQLKYNAARALSQLGRLDEAAATLAPLYARELPTLLRG